MRVTALQVARTWIAEAGVVDGVDIDPLRRALRDADNDVGVPLGRLMDLIAAEFDPSRGWLVFIPIAQGDTPAGDGVAVVDSESCIAATWAGLRSDDSLWIAPSTRLAGVCDTSEIPFAFDAAEWERTLHNFAYEEGEWFLRVDADRQYVDLPNSDLRYRDERSIPPAGCYVEIEEGGTSMTTGPIGVTVSVDERGAAWTYQWGYEHIFHGRQPVGFSLCEFLPEVVSGVARISSDVLTPQQMRSIVDRVSAAVIDGLELEHVDVKCLGFDGTAAELVALTSSLDQRE